MGILEEFPAYEEITKDRMKAALCQVAAINLKKLTGAAVADISIVGAFALRDRNLLRRQIQDIQPHYIVGCGTFEILAWLLELDIDPFNPFEYTVRHGQTGAWVVPFRHPNRANKLTSYEELKARILRKK